MPNIQYPSLQQVQGTLLPGATTLLTAPQGYMCHIKLRFNNPAAYDITVNITRVTDTVPPSTLQCYSLTLNPGDTLEDDGYTLYPDDSIEVVTAAANTNYFLDISYQFYYRTR